MKRYYLLLFFLLPAFLSKAQFYESDSLITEPLAFQNLLTRIDAIDAKFESKDSITFLILETLEWEYICSYKTGWKESIGTKSDGTGIGANRQNFNDIYVPRKAGETYTYSGLKSKFNLKETDFRKDTSGNIVNGPISMSLNSDFLIIRSGGYYPNGSQTSWDYNHTYYFKRKSDN